MTTAFLEIVEMENGDIALRRQGSEGQPLVSIRFSSEAIGVLQEHHADVARIMLSAGLQAVNRIQEDGAIVETAEPSVPEGVTLH